MNARSIPDMTRRFPSRARRALVFALPALAAGCSILPASAPRQWYRLEDAASTVPGAGPKISAVLLIEQVSTSALHEGSALVFSREPGVLAHYRFADWAEPPGRRVAQLLVRRLEARGRFDAVGLSTSGLAGGLLLRVGLDTLVHDLSGASGVARLAVQLELVDWRRRRRIAQRHVMREAPVATPDAAGAASAFGQALAAVFDEAAPWVEAEAGRAVAA